MVVLFDMSVVNYPLIVVSAVVTTLAISSSGTLYGVIASDLACEKRYCLFYSSQFCPRRNRGDKAFGDAFGRVNADGWAWLGFSQ